MKPLCALIVEDSADDAALLIRVLEKGGYDPIVSRVETATQMEGELDKSCWEVILSDYQIPGFGAPKALEIAQRRQIDLPFIVVSGTIGEEAAVELMRAGAHDYVMKGNIHRLPAAIDRELREAEIRRERRKADKALIWHAQELARTNAELEQFIHVASHDLKEPLRMVAAYTELLEKSYRGKLGADADEYIAFASEGAHRIHRLVDDLLAYSKIGRSTEGFQSTNTGEIFDRAQAGLDAAYQEAGARVTRGAMPVIQAHPRHLQLLFENLLDNALKFRGASPLEVDVRVERQDAGWLFSVKDNGGGIDSLHVEKIFTIFQRLHAREERSGNGIGLAIAKRIVENHGGRIWVDSEVGRGSTFHFTLRTTPDQNL